MADDPISFPASDDLSSYTQGMESDNPLLRLLSVLMMGSNYTPKPVGNQSVYDAYLMKARSQNFLRMQANSMQNNQLMMAMGINPNSAIAQTGSLLFGGPNSPAVQAMAPLIGGNPLAAQMQTYAGFTGMTMGAFGRTDNVSYGETQAGMNAVMRNFYNWKQYDVQAANDKIIKEFKSNFKTQQDFQKQFHTNIPLASVNLDWINAQKTQFTQDNTATINSTLLDLRGIGNSSASTDQKRSQITSTLTGLRSSLLSSGLAQDKIDAYIPLSAVTSGTTDGVKLDNISGWLSDIKNKPLQHAQDMAAGVKQMAGKDVVSGINYQNTRGFNIEDFTSAAVAMADLRLGGRRGQSVSDFEGNVMGTTGGVLSAARSIFGTDKSGGDLISEISRLMGGSDADLSQGGEQGGAQRIEKMLRDMKAAARVAGVSIKAVLGIINEAKALADANPNLQGLSGETITRLVTKSTTETQFLNEHLPGGEVRRMGGTQGMMASLVADNEQLMTSPAMKQLTALSYYYKDNLEAMKLINATMSKPIDMYTMSQLDRSLGDIDKTRGWVGVSLLAGSEALQKAGRQDTDVSKAVSEAAPRVREGAFLLAARLGGKPDIVAQVAAAAQDYKNKHGDLEGFSNVGAAARILGVNNAASNLLYGPDGKPSPYMEDYLLTAGDPKIAADKKVLEAQVKADEEADTDLAKREDYLNAGKPQVMFQSWMSGDLKPENAFNIFWDRDKNGKVLEMTDAQQAVYDKRVSDFKAFAGDIYDAQNSNLTDAVAARKATDKATIAFLQKHYGINVSQKSLDSLRVLASKWANVDEARAFISNNRTGKYSDVVQLAETLGAGTSQGYESLTEGINNGTGYTGAAQSAYWEERAKYIENLPENVAKHKEYADRFSGALDKYKGLSPFMGKVFNGLNTDQQMALFDNHEDLLERLRKAGYKGGDATGSDLYNYEHDSDAASAVIGNEDLNSKIFQQENGQADEGTDIQSMFKKLLNAVEKTLPDAMNKLTGAIQGPGT